ncbi:hypothetical protein GCM10023186_13210 [Hymenobacter koreensis]|uniref:Fibronectin type-III domain-containing protein n=1 Tax=Hymenobacter koreensis TaxID=1084523 RepID=A0ABP8IX75_9BACT
MTGNNTFNVLLGNSSLTTLGTSQAWSTLTAGATQVYTSTTQQVTGAAGTYFSVTLAQPFVYTGGNLLVLTDHEKQGTATGVINFVVNPATGFAVGDADSAPVTTLTAASYGNNRPTLRVTYTPSSPCTTPPNGGTTVASASSLCAPGSVSLSLQGASFGTGLTYQWQQSTNGTSYTNIAGATGPTYTTPVLTTATFFRAVLTCSGASANSTPAQITFAAPTYATLPFFQGFENDWIDVCGIKDAPSNSWRTTPTTGNNSWRRNDDGISAGWVNPTSGAYTPTGSEGNSSARFHSFQASSGSIGFLDLYVNLSQAGDKILSFDYRNNTGSDSLAIHVSNDGGLTFGPALTRINLANAWSKQYVTISSTSATAVVRFRARADFGASDIGLDAVDIRSANACFAPNGLTVGAVTSTTAAISWGGIGAGSSYTVFYGPVGFTPGGTGSQTITGIAGTSTTITGLQAGTQYDVYVARICTDGSSLRTGPTSLATRPANDECATAATLTVGATPQACNSVNGTVLSATNSNVGTSGCSGTADDDVWYEFTATATAMDIRLTEGTGFDGVLQAFSGSNCGFLTASLGCRDVTTAGVEILSLTSLTVGTSYKVRVFSFSATAPTPANSSFSICVTPAPQPPVNDNCANATVLTPGQTCTPTTGTVFKATDSLVGTLQCSGTAAADDDVWYKFTATATAHDIRLTEGAGFDGVVQLFNGTCTSIIGSIACEDQSAGGSVEVLSATNLTVGQEYLVRVFSFTATVPTDVNSSFSICVTAPTPVPANDDCANATALTPSATCTPVNGSVFRATTSQGAPAACSGTADDDVWYSFLAAGTSHDIVVDEATSFDGVVQVFSGACSSLSVLQCIDASASGGEERLRVNGLTIGQRYYIRIFSFGSTAPAAFNSNFTICITPSPTPPVNDDCANAITLPVSFGTNCTSPVVGTNLGASGSSGVASPTCGTYAGGDVWYKVTVPPSGGLRLETAGGGSTPLTDTDLSVYSGTCGNLTQIVCDAASGTGSHGLLNISGRTPGEVLYVRVWESGNNAEGGFTVCASSPTTCAEPGGLAATNITSSSATLTYAGSGISYTVEYGPVGFAPGTGTVRTQAGQSVAITGLAADTEYCFYVTQTCTSGANPSPTVGPVCFRTSILSATNDEPCAAIQLLPNVTVQATNFGATTTIPNGYSNPAQSGCSNAANPRDVWFRARPVTSEMRMEVTGTSAGTLRVFSGASCSGALTDVSCRVAPNVNSSLGQFSVTGLTPGQEYYISVAGLTSGATTGPFTIVYDRVLSTRNPFVGELNVFPNPVSGGEMTVQLRGVGKAAKAQLQLINAIGQVVHQETISISNGSADGKVSMTPLARGLYTLRLQVGQTTTTRKVTVE